MILHEFVSKEFLTVYNFEIAIKTVFTEKVRFKNPKMHIVHNYGYTIVYGNVDRVYYEFNCRFK